MKENNQPKKMGRPVGSTIDNPQSATLPLIRVTPGKLATYKAASKSEGKTFSAWVRTSLDQSAKI